MILKGPRKFCASIAILRRFINTKQSHVDNVLWFLLLFVETRVIPSVVEGVSLQVIEKNQSGLSIRD